MDYIDLINITFGMENQIQEIIHDALFDLINMYGNDEEGIKMLKFKKEQQIQIPYIGTYLIAIHRQDEDVIIIDSKNNIIALNDLTVLNQLQFIKEIENALNSNTKNTNLK